VEFRLAVERAVCSSPNLRLEKWVNEGDFLTTPAVIASLRSEAYRSRFGENSGRWWVVPKSEQRLEHLRRQAEVMTGTDRDAFLFATLPRVISANILSERIWRARGEGGSPG
jgi:hypothetical protein